MIMIKIHDKLWYIVSPNRQDENNLAYMTYYEENKAFEKRSHTGINWAGVSGNVGKIILNTPRNGFTIHDSVSRWSTQNKLFRVYDPAGFTVEVPTGNISTLLKYVTVVNGVIQQNCVWGRCGQDHVLLPEGSEPYNKALVQTEQSNSAVNLSKLVAGDTCKFKADGAEYIYIGKAKYVWSVEVKDRNYNYFGYFSANKTETKMLGTEVFTETRYRHYFYPVDDTRDYNRKYIRKSSGKVIITGRVEVDSIHPNIEYTGGWDYFKELYEYIHDKYCNHPRLTFNSKVTDIIIK